MASSAEVVVPTSQVPLKPPLLATAKTTNYLVNALMAMAAEVDAQFAVGSAADEGSVEALSAATQPGAGDGTVTQAQPRAPTPVHPPQGRQQATCALAARARGPPIDISAALSI